MHMPIKASTASSFRFPSRILIAILLTAVLNIGGLISTQTTAEAAGTPRLNAGEKLKSGMSLVSKNGAMTLTMRSDGNLVLLTSGGSVYWSSNTAGNPGAFAEMQTDGNFVIYTPAYKPIYATKTNNKATYAQVEDDGRLVLYSSANQSVWSVPDKPGASNTGVPAGKKLTVHEGDLKITKDNTVIDSMEIRGLVRVEAKNVVIKNCLITGRYLSSSLSLVYVNDPKYSVTIQDSELYAKYPSPYVHGVIGQNFTLERVNIHHVIDQVTVTGNNVLVKDSWLHDNLYYLEDPNYNNTPTHDDNVQIQIGRNIQLIHNTMSSTHNAAVMVTQDRGVVGDVLIERNFVSDGASGFNLAQKSYGTLKGFVIKNNIFTRTQKYAGCAIIVDASSGPLLLLSGNVWADGAPVSVINR